MENKNLIEILSKGGIAAVLLYIIVFFGGKMVENFSAMQKDILEIRVELTKIQSTLLSKDDISCMIDGSVKYHQARFHNGKQ